MGESPTLTPTGGLDEKRGWRTFFILWLTQSLSVWGNAIRFFTITFWITGVLFALDRSQAAYSLAAVSVAVSVTSILIAPVVGSWTDRLSRRRLMLFCDLLSGLLSLALAGLMLTQRLSIGVLIPWVVCFTVLRSGQQSAFGASYAMLLTERQLARGNAMMQTANSLMGVIAPGIAAGLISLPAAHLLPRFGDLVVTGAPFAVLADALTFFVAALALVFLDIPSPAVTRAAPGARTTLRAHFGEGLKFLRGQPGLLWLLMLFAVGNLLLPTAFVLEPLVVKFGLAASWQRLGYTYAVALALMTSALSVGGVVGGAVISLTGGLRSRRVTAIVAGFILQGVALGVFGLSSSLYLAAAAIVAVGLLGPWVNAHSQTVWQVVTPSELQGRVFATRRAATQTLSPLGTALGGWLSALVAPGGLVAAMGGILAVFGATQLLNGSLLRADAPAAPDSRQGFRMG